MSKENYLSESALKDSPVKKYRLKLREGSVTTDKIADGNVTTEKVAEGAIDTGRMADRSVTAEKIADKAVGTSKIEEAAVTYDKIKDSAVIAEKIADGAVTTDKIELKGVTNEKLGDQAVDSRTLREANVQSRHIANEAVVSAKIAARAVNEDKIEDQAIGTRVLKDENVTKEKIAAEAVTTEKIADKNVTNEKIADDTLTIDKFDADLRDAINAATGLPADMVKKIQDITESVAELQDSEFPIVLSLSVTADAGVNSTNVSYSVTSKGKAFVPDTLDLRKNDTILSNRPVASGTVNSPINSNREVFSLSVTKQGRTGKQTSLTRYLCHYGCSTEASMTSTVLDSLTKTYTTGVGFNPRVTTKDNEYIWLVVPSYLSISSVKSAGFDVSMAAVQTISTAKGSYKAYRTLNPLTAATWNLVIA